MQGTDVVVGSVTFGTASKSAVVWLLQSAARRPRGEEAKQRTHATFTLPVDPPHARRICSDISMLCRSVHRVGAWTVGDGPCQARAYTRRLQHDTGVPRGLLEREALQGHGLGDQLGSLPAANYRRIEPTIGIPVVFGREPQDGQSGQNMGVLGNDTRTHHSCRWSGWQTPMGSIARFGDLDVGISPSRYGIWRLSPGDDSRRRTPPL